MSFTSSTLQGRPEPRQLIVPAYTVIAALYCAISAVLFGFYVGSTFLGLVHWVGFFGVVMNYLGYLRFHQERVATFVILFIGTLVVTSLYATGGWNGTGYLWPFAYLPYAFFLAKRGDVVTWVAILFLACGTFSVLDVVGFYDRADGPVAVGNFFAALAVFAGCMFLFKTTVEKSERNADQAARLAAQAHLEQAAQHAEVERLEDMNRFKTQFLNMAAHELATPITPIKIQLYMLRQGQSDALTPRQARRVDVVGRNMDRLEHLVGDLLDAAKLQAGRITVHMQDVDLALVIEETVEALADSAARAGVKLSADHPTHIHVDGDPIRLSQIFFNLINNAIKFTPRGGEIRILTRVQQGRCVTSVTDTGAGLTSDQISRLFQPFTQVHSDPQYSGGTGLGLYISRGIAELHGGRLFCTSAGPGKGASFWIDLPLAVPTGGATRLVEARSVAHR